MRLDAYTFTLANPVEPWVAELGLRLADGGFVAVARSSPVGAPQAPPPDTAVTWVVASRPTIPVAHAWDGRRLPARDEARGGSSDVFVR